MKEPINPYCIKHKCKNIQDKTCKEKFNTCKIINCPNINKQTQANNDIKR